MQSMFASSEESTAGNPGSYISQATSHLTGKSQKSKLNLNKNKFTSSCKEFKNIEDEWLFVCDNVKVFEVQDGNVFYNPSVKYDVEGLREIQEKCKARRLRQKVMGKYYK